MAYVLGIVVGKPQEPGMCNGNFPFPPARMAAKFSLPGISRTGILGNSRETGIPLPRTRWGDHTPHGSTKAYVAHMHQIFTYYSAIES